MLFLVFFGMKKLGFLRVHEDLEDVGLDAAEFSPSKPSGPQPREREQKVRKVYNLRLLAWMRSSWFCVSTRRPSECDAGLLAAICS